MPSSQPVLVIIGPSASGKSSVVRELADRHLVEVHPTWTTRSRRADEEEGSPEHRFVSEAEFDALESSGFFLETVAMFGLPFRYGLPPIARDGSAAVPLVMLRAPLVERFAREVPDLVVYQIEDSAERVHERLVQRGCDSDDLRARLADNERELILGRRVSHRVFVNDGPIEDTVRSIARALRHDVRGVAA